VNNFKLCHKNIVGVVGGHQKNTTPVAIELAQKIGTRLAMEDFAVASGGEDGIMESIFKGAKSVNGTTIAITKSNDKKLANQFSDYVIPTSLDLAFMNVLIWSSDAIVALDGKFGTMCEIALALDIGKNIVLIGKHELINTKKIKGGNFLHLKDGSSKNIDKAIKFIKEKIK
jgi:hypothetical protein